MLKVNLEKAKAVAHQIRRQDRDAKMNPLDTQATIPLFAEQAETEREAIRVANATVQDAIDAGTGVAELKAALEAL